MKRDKVTPSCVRDGQCALLLARQHCFWPQRDRQRRRCDAPWHCPSGPWLKLGSFIRSRGRLWVHPSPLTSLPPTHQRAMHKHTKSASPKTLWFADTGKHRSAPSTPATSPSLSDITLPGGPATPHLHTVPLPDVDEEPRLHRALAYIPAQRPLLSWDTAYPPHQVALSTHAHDTVLELRPMLCEPATNPSTETVTLVNPEVLPKYSIIIFARNEPYVTVFDVLNGLYGFLRMPLSRVEYGDLPIDCAATVATAFDKRIAAFDDEADRRIEKLKGLKRIDLVLGAERTHFAGLSRHEGSPPDEWRLHLA